MGRVARRTYRTLGKKTLDSAGRRIGKIPSGAEDGVLRFRVSTRGPDGLACQFWEIASSGSR